MVRSLTNSSFFGLPPFNNPFSVVKSRRDSRRRLRKLLDRLSEDQQLELLGLRPIGNADGENGGRDGAKGDSPALDKKSLQKRFRKRGENGFAANENVEEQEEEEDGDVRGDDTEEYEEDGGEKEEEEDEEEYEKSEGEDAEKGDEEILMVDFDFFDAQPSDYHGVKALLRTFLDGKRWDLPAFVDAVTSGTPGGGAAREGDAAGGGANGGGGGGSGSVATVVKAGDEGNILGLTACLPLLCKSKGWTADFVRFLHEGCDNRAQWDELWKVMQRGCVGVVVCERVANLPFQLVPHLFRSTLQPMLEKGAPVEKFLILTRMYRQTGGKAARKQAKGAGSSGSELFFPKPEDELLKKLATSSYSFPVHADVMASRQLKGFQHLRLVMLLSAAQVRNFLEQVNDMVDED